MYTQRTQFAVEDRFDGIPQPWGFHEMDKFSGREDLQEIAQRLFAIPVKPLPDPLVSSNDDWRDSMNVSAYDFMETWAEYLNVLQEYGTICHSEFEQMHLYEDEEITLPRAKHAVRIVTRLPETTETPEPYLWVNIYGTGEVCISVIDNHVHSIYSEQQAEVNQQNS